MRFFGRVAVGASICISLAGVTPAAEQETAARPLPTAGEAKILAAFDQPTEIGVQGRPLGDVIEYFKQKHQIQIVLDNKALSDAGVGMDVPMTLDLRQVTLRSALRLLLQQLDLTYVVRDGYLMITSKTEAQNKLSFKVYPVQDLVTLDNVFRPAFPKNDRQHDSPVLSEVVPIPNGIGGLGFGGLDGPGTGRREETSDFQGLIEVITTTLAPTTWDEVGGPGSIMPNRNTQTIAVSQTDDAHEEIVVLLAALRRVRDQQVAAAEPVVPTAPPETPETKKLLQVRGYRFMRGTTNPGKSGWRPPVAPVGDSRPPRNQQASDKKQEAPGPSSEGGAGKEVAPAKDTGPAKEAAPVAGATDKGAPRSTDAKLEALAEKIAALVPTMIDPESWEPSGAGMIRAVGEGVVVRHTEEVQHRVARLMAELLPDCVPMGFNGPWGPWKPALLPGHAGAQLRVAATGDWPHQAEPRPSGEEARAHDALLEKCDLQFDQLPLIDALTGLAAPRHVQLYLDRKALADAGVGTDTPITISAKELSYAAALQLLLDELDLIYLVRDEVLLITSKTEAENLLTTKVYPVFDLVARPPNAPVNRPNIDFTSLIENVTVNIAPTTWDEVGGPGAIQPFANSAALVISQTTEVHQEIAEYLRALREAGAAQKLQRADANK